MREVDNDKVAVVFLASFASGPWQANCYLVGPDGSDQAIVIDPGVEAADTVRSALAEYGRRAAGVLLTHGHVDHVADAATVADEAGVPAWLHSADVDLLDDPASGNPMMAAMIDQLGVSVGTPADLRTIAGGESLEVAGLTFEVVHAPGHRPGCVMFRLGADTPEEIVFSGDVLFAGSIGRMDLPGGDSRAMTETLKNVVLPLPDAAAVLPGHGPATTMARERSTNPYLQPSYVR